MQKVQEFDTRREAEEVAEEIEESGCRTFVRRIAGAGWALYAAETETGERGTAG